MNVQALLQILIPLAVRTLVLPELQRRLGVDTVPAQLISAATLRLADAIASIGDGLTLERLEQTAKALTLAILDESLRAVEGRAS